jgi:hypothetical protein
MSTIPADRLIELRDRLHSPGHSGPGGRCSGINCAEANI